MTEPARTGDVGVLPSAVAAEFMNAHVEDVLASLSAGLVLLDLEGRVTFMSPGAEDLTGVSAAQALGRPAAQAFAGHPWLVTTLDAIGDRETRRVNTAGDLFGPLGRRVSVRLNLRPVLDASGSAVGSLLVLDDVAAQRSLNDTVERGPRVSDLSVVAAGLAHEIKNPLGGIKGAAQLLAETLAADPESLRFTELITHEVDRVSALLEQLLELTRPPRIHPVAINVHRVLQDVLLLARAGAGESLTVRCVFDPSLPDLWADEAQLRQVFLNLVKNAIEAVRGAGTLTITTRIDTDFLVRAPGTTRGTRFLSVDVEDNGPGIQPEDLERMFTPFFTTKAQGTGLGLTICHRIVTQHGGLVRVESEPGRGTRIRVSLPVAMPAGES